MPRSFVAGIVVYQLATYQSPEEQVRRQSEAARLVVMASHNAGQPVPEEMQAHADYAFVTQRHDAGNGSRARSGATSSPRISGTSTDRSSPDRNRGS